MSIDVDALLAAEKRAEGQSCHTCRWLETRDEAERAKWIKALEDEGSFSKAQITRAMTAANEQAASPDWAPPPGPDSIGNHRRGHRRNLGMSGRR